MHLGLALGWFYVIHPDLEQASQFEFVPTDRYDNLSQLPEGSSCVEFAELVRWEMFLLIICHIYSSLFTLGAEIFETALD